MRLFLVGYVGCVLITAPFCTAFTSAEDADSQREDVWSKIAPFFQPPEELVGDYRSPLLFDDGRPVRTPEEWQQRRKEILRFWHEALGPWPALIERPAVEVLQTEDREGLLQKKIRLQAAPELEIEGYLLMPPGDEPRPAVLVVYYDAETGAGLNPKSKLRDLGYQLARRGFVSLSIGWPGGYTQQESPTRQPLSSLAYIAANCHNTLANMPEVDPKRVGVTELECQVERLVGLPLSNPEHPSGPVARCPACGGKPTKATKYEPAPFCPTCLDVIMPSLMRVQSCEEGFGTEAI